MKKYMIFLVLIIAVFLSLKAVPAFPDPVEYKLPDGFVRYDEYGNEITTKEHLRDHGWCMKTPMEKIS
mgnify:CR=1 FL=1